MFIKKSKLIKEIEELIKLRQKEMQNKNYQNASYYQGQIDALTKLLK